MALYEVFKLGSTVFADDDNCVLRCLPGAHPEHFTLVLGDDGDGFQVMIAEVSDELPGKESYKLKCLYDGYYDDGYGGKTNLVKEDGEAKLDEHDTDRCLLNSVGSGRRDLGEMGCLENGDTGPGRRRRVGDGALNDMLDNRGAMTVYMA